MTTTLTKSERTKRTLRRAATDCFRENGYQSATTAEIARRADVSEGTLFLHYTNKLGLLTAVTRDFYRELQSRGEAIVTADDVDAADRLRSLVLEWTDTLAADWYLIQVFVQTSQSHPGTELADLVIDANRRYSRLFVDLIATLQAAGDLPDVPTALLRDIVFGSLEHTARGQQYAAKQINVRAAGRQVLDLLMSAGPPAADDRLSAIENKLDDLLDRLPRA